MENRSTQDRITINLTIAGRPIDGFSIPRDKEGIYRNAVHEANHKIAEIEETFRQGTNKSILLALIHGYAMMLEEGSRNSAYTRGIKELLEEIDTALKKKI